MAKNIVICCDGTQAKYDVRSRNTNVVRLFERLAPDGTQQFSYYDPGVGTYSRMNTGPGRWVSNLLVSISGVGLTSNGWIDGVHKAYGYLMDQYQPGDRVFLFGYSRGAYTVRVLAGLLHRCGLLTRGSDNLIPYVTHIKDDVAGDFKATFSRPCRVHFIGVWDTVASVGLVRRRYFRNTRLDPGVRFAYQALALDERRRHFRASMWDESEIPDGQVIQQVWFPGCHGDVGGQEADRGISDIPLAWMLEHAQERGLLLAGGWRVGLRPNATARIRRSDTGIWRLWTRDRPVGQGAKVHRSVVRRWETDEGYRPSLPGWYETVR